VFVVKGKGLFVVCWGNGNWALRGRIDGWVLMVKVVNPSLIASRSYQVSVNSASLIIHGLIFIT
jgi:hypothetical protein